MQQTFEKAVEQALIEMGLEARARDFNLPQRCPYTLSELLNTPIDTLAAKLS